MWKYALPLAALLALLLVGMWGADVLLDLRGGEDSEATHADLDGLERGPEPAPAPAPDGVNLAAPVYVPPRVPPETMKAGQATAGPGSAADAERAEPASDATPNAEDNPDGVWTDEGDSRPRQPRTTAGRTHAEPSGIHHVGNMGTQPIDAEAWVPAGIAWLGTPERWVRGVLRAQGENAPTQILSEIPRHSRVMDGYWIERWEVANERYRRFLDQRHGARFTTPLGSAKTLLETTAVLIGPEGIRGRDLERIAFQLYHANRATLQAALPGLVVTLRDGSRLVEEAATWGKMQDALLPAGLRLYFFDRAPPAYWPDVEYPAGLEDHPVRDLSALDAAHFALWAGKHVPTEPEWEYAARGPQGLDYPWGNNAQFLPEFVNGGRTRPQDEDEPFPVTLPIRALPRGATWVGCRNMLGNVAEWTSSFLAPYQTAPDDGSPFVVARGGAAIDESPLHVRSAYRGWAQGQGEDGGTKPHEPRGWTGLRLARYEEVGRSRLPSMHTLVCVGGAIDPASLAPRVYAGWQGELRARILRPRQDPTVRMGAKSFVVQPLSAVVVRGPRGNGRVELPEEVTDTAALASRSHVGPVLLGLLQTDLRLLNAYRERDEGRPLRPTLDRVPCPPGVWIVALDRGYLALFAPGLRHEFFLSRGPVSSATVGVTAQRTRRGEGIRSRAEISGFSGGVLKYRFGTPLGHPERPELMVHVRFETEAEIEVVKGVSDWQYGFLEE